MSDPPPIGELRRRALALAQVKSNAELGPYRELIAELLRVLDTMQADARELKIRLGYLSSQLTGLVGQETAEQIAPIALELSRLTAEVAILASRVTALERTVGEALPPEPRSLGGEG
jgi:hypothetical protein